MCTLAQTYTLTQTQGVHMQSHTGGGISNGFGPHRKFQRQLGSSLNTLHCKVALWLDVCKFLLTV